MNRLAPRRTFGVSGRPFFYCAAVFLLLGIVGIGIQNRILGGDSLTNSELLQRLQSESLLNILATVSVVFQILESCAIPIFAFLLVQLADSGANYERWMLYVLGAAVLLQIPYAMVGGAGFNTAFSVLMAMVMVYFFRRFREKKLGHILLKLCAILCTFLWGNILGFSGNATCIVVTAVLWPLRNKKTFQVFAGLAVTLACSVFSLFNLIAPISFAALHLYNGELGLPEKA